MPHADRRPSRTTAHNQAVVLPTSREEKGWNRIVATIKIAARVYVMHPSLVANGVGEGIVLPRVGQEVGRVFGERRVKRMHGLGAAALLLACQVGTPGADDLGVATDDGSAATSSSTAALDTDGGTADSSDSASLRDDELDTMSLHFDLGQLPDLGEMPPVASHCHEIDLLFVIDNSYSMADEQANLVASVPGFIAGITEMLGPEADYRVGVITTDAYAFNTFGCTRLGDLVTQTGGEASSQSTCGPFVEGQPFMTDADRLGEAFSCAAAVGISGASNEKPMEALTTLLMRNDAPCAGGFVRDDAVLVIVVITDEEDDGDSDRNPADWHDTVLAAKDDDVSKVMVLSLVGLAEPNACQVPWDGADGAEYAPRLADFTERFPHGTVGDVCAADYSPYFTKVLEDLESVCTSSGPQG